MDHKLGACRNRAMTQIDRAVHYLNLVTPAIPADDDASRQFLFQSLILMLQSFYEEYLRCVVALGTFWKAPEIRAHLAIGQKEPEQIALMPAAKIAEMAQDRIAFQDEAKRLKALITVVTGRGPFPDEATERRCLDFANVRNLIAHRGGMPYSVTAPIARLESIAVQSTEIGTGRFHKLHITVPFFVEGLTGIKDSIVAIEAAIASDPVLSLKLDSDQ